MKQKLEVKMEGLAGLRIVIHGHGTGGTFVFEGKPWKKMLHGPGSRAVVAWTGSFPRLESRWGSCSFKAYQRAALGQQEDKPSPWRPGTLQLGCAWREPESVYN